MHNRSGFDRRRDFDEREHPRDSRGRFVDDDEAAYRGRSYEDDDFGDERGENERRRYFGEEFGDYPGGYASEELAGSETAFPNKWPAGAGGWGALLAGLVMPAMGRRGKIRQRLICS